MESTLKEYAPHRANSLEFTSIVKGGKNRNGRVASHESVSSILMDQLNPGLQCLFMYFVQIGRTISPIALRTAKTLWSFGRSECNRIKWLFILLLFSLQRKV